MPETPALSPHIAHLLATESPLHAWTAHRLMGGVSKPPTSAQEMGTLLHHMLLEGGDNLSILEFDSYRSAAAKEARTKAVFEGKIPCLREKAEDAGHIVGRWMDRLADIRIQGAEIYLHKGKTEYPLEWTEDGVLCHGRADWLSDDRQLLIDLKAVSGSCHPDACTRSLLDTAGVIQDHAYRACLDSWDVHMAGRTEMVFLFAQTIEPYCVTPIYLGGSMREIGSGRWRRAKAIWSRCTKTGVWPSYSKTPIRAEAPGWALAKEMSEAGSE